MHFAALWYCSGILDKERSDRKQKNERGREPRCSEKGWLVLAMEWRKSFYGKVGARPYDR